MVANIAAGGAAINALAEVAGATVRVADLAVDADPLSEQIGAHKVRRASGDIRCEDALTQTLPSGKPLQTPVIVNPPPGLATSTQPLFNGQTNGCFGGARNETYYGRYENRQTHECLKDSGRNTGAPVVAVVSGGNNDVSRYAEVVERALIHEGRKHYFLVDFPQEPGALRRFLDEVLGPDDDITLFEYIKRSNRETGPALVGIELSRPEDLPALLDRMKAAPPSIEKIDSSSPLFRFLL